MNLWTTYGQNGSMPSKGSVPNVGRRPKHPHHRAGLVTLAQAEISVSRWTPELHYIKAMTHYQFLLQRQANHKLQ